MNNQLHLTISLFIVYFFSTNAHADVTYSGTAGVAAQVFTNCTSCHSSSLGSGLRSGAPLGVNYDTYAQSTSGTNESLAVTRINAGTMPPSGALSGTLQTLITDWQGDGYPNTATVQMRTDAEGSTTASTAVLNGSIKENGVNTSARMMYRLTSVTEPGSCPSNTTSSGCTTSTAVSGTGGNDVYVGYSRTATGLSCGSSYWAKAISSTGIKASSSNFFSTSNCSDPIIQTAAGGALGSTTSITISEDSTTTTDLSLQAFDTNGGTRTWSINSTGTLGSVSFVSGDNTTSSNTENVNINYVPPTNANGASYTTFVVTVDDDTTGSQTSSGDTEDFITVTVNINAVNDAPTLNNNSNAAVGALDSVTITSTQLDYNDIDDIDDDITYTVTSDVSRGVLRRSGTTLTAAGTNTFTQQDITNNSLTYEETSAGGVGSDSFNFSIADDGGASGGTGTFTINISANSPPVVTAGGTLNFNEGNSASIIDNSITVTDTDTDSIVGAVIDISSNYAGAEDQLSFSPPTGITGNYVAGTLTLSGTSTAANYQTALRSIRYSNSSDNPSDSSRTIRYRVSDPAGTSTAVTSTVNVTPVNDQPAITATNAPASGTEDVAITPFTPSFTDPDDSNNGTGIIWGLSGEPTGMTISSTGLIQWTPTEGQTSSGTVTVSIEDGNEDISAPDTDTFSFSITPINDAPVITATNAPANGTELTPISFNVSVTDPDDTNNGTDISWSLSGQPAGMTISNTGQIQWTPPLSSTTSGLVTVSVEDGNEDTSAPDTDTFTISIGLDDVDGDLISASIDNCPSTSNADQADSDNDNIGDDCDPDNGNDGLIDSGIEFTVTQNSVDSPFVFLDIAPVTVSITASAAISGIDFSGMTFNWSPASEILTLASYIESGDTISFDPSSLPLDTDTNSATFVINLSIDNGSTPLTDSIILTVNQTGPATTGFFDCNGNGVDDATGQEELTEDCDGDGTPNNDISEGFGDTDNDGIPNYLDHSSLSNNTANDQTNDISNAVEIVTQTGLNLRVGATARHAQRTGLIVSLKDISQFGGNGGSPGNNADDSYSHVGGIYDFEISGLAPGDTAQIVIPLSTTLPANAVYRKYKSDGWTDFVSDSNNSLASAPYIGGVSGMCPATGDTSYTSGLTAFNGCLQITLEDGGPNDTDGEVNGVIRDPGGPAIATTGESRDTVESVDGGGGKLSIYEILVMLMLLLIANQYKIITTRQ